MYAEEMSIASAVYTGAGLLVLLLPFVALRAGKRSFDFVTTLLLVILFHLAVALLAGMLGIFTAQTVFAAHLLATAALAATGHFRIPRISFPRIDWMLVAVVVIAVAHLFLVHYRYTGLVSLAVEGGYHEVRNMTYPYPYYADEWYAVAFIQESIADQSLPLQHPFFKTPTFFPNFQFAFHALLAEIVLLLNLDPLVHYTLLNIGINTLLVALVYLFLREHKVGLGPAALAALALLYVTHSANLPTVWTLMPITLGLLGLLLTLFFLKRQEWLYLTLATGVALMFYPPLVVFLLPGIAVRLWLSRAERKVALRRAAMIGAAVVLAAGLIVIGLFIGAVTLKAGPLPGLIQQAASMLVYPSFTPDASPSYWPLLIIPLPVILAALAGLPRLLKHQRELLAMIGVGGIFWLLYVFVDVRLVIEYQRAIFATALLTTIAAGFGLQWVADSFREYTAAVAIASLAALAVLVAALPWYTSRTTWQNLSLVLRPSGTIVNPAAPANRYLTDQDLEVFRGISGQAFLSSPWKGTVLGVATDNYPLTIKPGTLTLHPNLAAEFMEADCQKRGQIATYYGIDYAYLPPFICSGWQEEGRSKEGFHLYRYQPSSG